MKKLCCDQSCLAGWHVRSIPPTPEEELIAICGEPERDESGRFEQVESSKKTAVYRFTWASESYFLKHYLFENWKKYLTQRFNTARLIQTTQEMIDAGFSTPEIRCYARRGRAMFTIARAAEAETSLDRLYRVTDFAGVGGRYRFLERFGEEIGRLHAAGFVHGDLRWGNVLVKDPASDEPEFIYLDNDRTRRYRRVPARGRTRNLVQIHFIERLLEHPAADWEAFWRGYCRMEPTVAGQADYWAARVRRVADQRVKHFYQKADWRERLDRLASKE